MSDIDLSAAVDAAAERFAASHGIDDWAAADPMVQHGSREIVLPLVAAAAPLIEQAVREQVAAEIEAARDADMSSTAWRARQNTYTDAARIARGGAS